MKYTWEAINLKPDPVYGSPLARSSHGVSVVPGTDGHTPHYLLLYGGEHVARTPVEPPSQALWKADLVQKTWKAIIIDTSNAPPPRVAHAQAYHAPTQTLYIMGGRTGVALEETALDDLWALNVESETWTQIHPTNNSSIEARSFHRMICVDDSLYVFGGCGAVSGRLADLHRLDLSTQTWHALPVAKLKGRGGPNFTRLGHHHLLVWAGFAGHETNDGQVFDLKTGKWQDIPMPTETSTLRPRSVCVAGTLQNGSVVVFGGEVDPSDRGHEGAGGFCADVLVIQQGAADQQSPSLQFQQDGVATNSSVAPCARGWSAGDALGNSLFVFGGLTGDDTNPQRLGDLWKLTVE